MHQPMQGAMQQVKGQRENDADLVIERCIAALYDLGSRPNATRSGVMKALKSEGFTSAEIAEAARRMNA